MLTLVVAAVSLVATFYGISSAILAANYYWYAYFTVGSYVCFGLLNCKLHEETTLPLGTGRRLVVFLKIYGAYFIVGFTIDVVYGRLIGGMWTYPHFSVTEEIIHVLLIGYPFAFFSVVETYLLIRFSVSTLFGTLTPKSSRRPLLMKVVLTIGISSLLIPLAFPVFNPRRLSNEIMFLSMLGTIFFFDSINSLRGASSLLEDTISGNWVTTISILLTNLVTAFIHEVPNTFANEWVYQNVPFTNYTVWDVNVLILTFGWLFLVVVPLSVRNLVETNQKFGA